MKFGICNEIFHGWEIGEVFKHAAALGYQGVEIAPFTLAPLITDFAAADRARVRRLASSAGVEICGLHWLLAKTDGMHLNHPEAAVRQRTSQYLCDLVDCCADLGGKILVLGSPKQRDILPGVTPRQAWDWAVETLRAPAQRAGANGLTICLEPLSPAETNFLNTAAEAIRFANQFSTPAVKIILDVKAMCSEPQPIPEIIRQSRGAFAHFHANDSNLKGPGFGAVDFRPIAAALQETGYDGYVSVEVFRFEDGAETIAAKSLECLRSAFGAG